MSSEPNHEKTVPPIWMRIVVLLSRYTEDDSYTANMLQSQTGMGSKMNISRSHAAVEVNKLLKSGFIEVSLRHIPEQGRRVNCYFLTELGRRQAQYVLKMHPDIEELYNASPNYNGQNNAQSIRILEGKVNSMGREIERLERMVRNICARGSQA